MRVVKMLEDLERELEKQHAFQRTLLNALRGLVRASEERQPTRLEAIERVLSASADGMTVGEIAESTNISSDVVRTILNQHKHEKFKAVTIGPRRVRWRAESCGNRTTAESPRISTRARNSNNRSGMAMEPTPA